MDRPRIHLIAPAGSCRGFLESVGATSSGQFVRLVQDFVGPEYRVTGTDAIIEAVEDELRAGRDDDIERAADIEHALADDKVAAVIAIRGGAWFTRVLPLIDFSVLQRRVSPIAVFAFSELTTIINIVGAYEQGIGVHYMGPAFLEYGMRMYAAKLSVADRQPPSPKAWVAHRLVGELNKYFADVVSMIEGRGTERKLVATLASGDPPPRFNATFVGGNLTVLSTLIGSRYVNWLGPDRRWLLLEDFNDKLERIDRFLAHLSLAELWDDCGGVLLGDFHNGLHDMVGEVITLLEKHIPPELKLPIMLTRQVGHVWPMAPLPLHVPITLRRGSAGEYSFDWSPSSLQTV